MRQATEKGEPAKTEILFAIPGALHQEQELRQSTHPLINLFPDWETYNFTAQVLYVREVQCPVFI